MEFLLKIRTTDTNWRKTKKVPRLFLSKNLHTKDNILIKALI
jgi:hypothetical protein